MAAAFHVKPHRRDCCHAIYYTENVNKVLNQGLKAGATNVMPVMDMFWGERYGQLMDHFGHVWSIATHKRNLRQEEIQKAVRLS